MIKLILALMAILFNFNVHALDVASEIDKIKAKKIEKLDKYVSNLGENIVSNLSESIP